MSSCTCKFCRKEHNYKCYRCQESSPNNKLLGYGAMSGLPSYLCSSCEKNRKKGKGPKLYSSVLE